MEIREGHNKFYINDEQGKQIAEIVFVPTGENCKRKLTAVCSHQTRIGNLDAHLI
ncbi:acyltransferase with acyl-CoA N-acyltransferase domain [Escherichia coli]|nr:acyltransferase with acyl-CoA N-acyltransferase domain [Escherichia coli]